LTLGDIAEGGVLSIVTVPLDTVFVSAEYDLGINIKKDINKAVRV
jgi:hypothetical protein